MTEPRTLAGRTIRIFQIFYDDASRAALDPAFIPLDNSSNERPDWAEYWPIRRFLLAGAFDDDELLGFLSPRFGQKTGMTGREVLAAIASREAEVYSFSPYFDNAALNPNPIRQGEKAHPGLLGVMRALAPELGVGRDVASMFCDQSTTIFSNYWVAGGGLWREWLALAERIFAIAEARRSRVAEALNTRTMHRGKLGYPMKVFVVERLITLLLESRGMRATWCLDPHRAPLATPNGEPLVDALLVLESLKTELRHGGGSETYDQYRDLQHAILEVIAGIARLSAEDAASIARAS
jgi:hypothetical protein